MMTTWTALLHKMEHLAADRPHRVLGTWHLARETVSRWRCRQQSRRQLAQLPAYLLRDIGLTEADRQAELNKPFWRE